MKKVCLALCLLCPASLVAATTAYYRFENGAFLADSGDLGLNLSNGGIATETALPASGNGSTFPNPVPVNGLSNGSAATIANTAGNDILQAPNNALWNDTSFTIEAIVNVSTSTGLRSIAGQLGNTGGRRWLMVLQDNDLAILMNGSSGAGGNTEAYFKPADSAMLNLATNTDYYLGISVNLTAVDPAGRLTFYMQDLTNGGALITSSTNQTVHTSLVGSSAPFTIGSTGHDSSHFSGLIDEVRFTDEVLGASQLLVAPEPSALALSLLGLLGLRRCR
ncbi:MAG: LamG-like jellyroll fold domain-containing protein [Verrucomicrobiales bacterium]